MSDKSAIYEQSLDPVIPEENFSGPVLNAELTSDRDTYVATNLTINNITNQLRVISEEVDRQFHKSGFVELELPEIVEQMFDPTSLGQLYEALLEQYLLLLFPTPTVPAAILLRHIASRLLKERQDDTTSVVTIRELSLSASIGDLQDFQLSTILTATESPCLFLIPQASRQILGWDMANIQRILVEGGHWLLAVAEDPIPAWRLSSSERPFMLEIKTQGLFRTDYLRQRLQNEISAVSERLPSSITAEWRDQATIAGRSVEHLLAQLHSPLEVQAFGTLLRQHIGALETTDLDKLISQAVSQPLTGTLRVWFFSELSWKQRLFALGSAIFSGLREEIFFIHLQRILSDCWGLREFRNRLIDYVDLEPLLPFFSNEAIRPGYQQIIPRYPGIRELLFKEAHSDYQRHFRQAVNWLVELLRQSVTKGVGRREGMQQFELRDELRQTIDETISDLGLLNSAMVEQPLLLLVGDQRGKLPTHVARIIARWYERGAEEQFFRLVKRWRTGREPLAAVQAWIREYGDLKRTDPQDALQACLILICTYAARSDQPDSLNPTLLEHLSGLTEPLGRLTLRSWQEYALPLLLPIHQHSLSPILRQLTVDDELRSSIVNYFVAQGQNEQMGIVTLIRDWLKAVKGAPAYIPGSAMQLVDTTLLTIVEILQRIPLDRERGITTTNFGLLLQRTASLPRHPQVKRAAMVAGILKNTVDDHLLVTLLESSQGDDDLVAVAEDLAQIYLNERATQPQRELAWKHAGLTIPLSLKGTRSTTSVERTIQNWLHDNRSPLAHQLAFYTALAQVRLLDQAEDAYLAEERRKAQEEAQNVLRSVERSSLDEATLQADASLEPEVTHRPQNWFQDNFVPIFVTLDAPELRAPITHLLPIARRYRQEGDEQLAFLLNKTWQYQGGRMSALAERLAEALDLCERGRLRLNESDRALHTLTIIFREQPRFQLLVLNIVVAILIGLLLASFIFLR